MKQVYGLTVTREELEQMTLGLASSSALASGDEASIKSAVLYVNLGWSNDPVRSLLHKASLLAATHSQPPQTRKAPCLLSPDDGTQTQ